MVKSDCLADRWFYHALCDRGIAFQFGLDQLLGRGARPTARDQKMKNKGFSVALSILGALVVCRGAADGEVPRIGFLGNSTAALEANLMGSFREGLRDLGYVEGRNILIEYRWAEGKYERVPVERPAKFELVINLRAAKQIGVTIPQSVLYRADKAVK